MTKVIQLTDGQTTLVSDHRFEYLSQWKWFTSCKNGARYAARTTDRKEMQVVIMGSAEGKLVDHIDGDGLNNQDENLRHATHAENSRNRRLNRNNTTGYKGVTLEKGKYYRSRIRFNYKFINLGSFPTAIEAAQAYDTKALELFGRFARTNFGPGGICS